MAHRTVSLAARLSLALAATVAVAGCKKKEAAPPAAGSNAAGSNAAGSAPATPPAPPPAAAPVITAAVSPADAVAAADRTAEDKALDAGRKPAELLTFLKVAPGMKVAELFAGGGYTVELLARVVGPTGTVYGQNTKMVLEKFAEKPWSARLARLASPSIVRVDRELGEPLPPEAKDLDLVVMHLVYHDTVWQGVDRAAMNAAIFAALKPGGEFAIVDHAAKPGAGPEVTKELHRIDQAVVMDDVTKAGFVLDRQSDLFAHPDDTRDWNAAPSSAADKRGTSDRFTLVFKKPATP